MAVDGDADTGVNTVDTAMAGMDINEQSQTESKGSKGFIFMTYGDFQEAEAAIQRLGGVVLRPALKSEAVARSHGGCIEFHHRYNGLVQSEILPVNRDDLYDAHKARIKTESSVISEDDNDADAITGADMIARRARGKIIIIGNRGGIDNQRCRYCDQNCHLERYCTGNHKAFLEEAQTQQTPAKKKKKKADKITQEGRGSIL
ncbi:hypothetical protein BJ166DRAFT_610582 [Pestalotiopsis sp. NC0098]|nr:hypothetical protein BJ166DRAFT_610582 [Pestalotiopsis sp. NC0098]